MQPEEANPDKREDPFSLRGARSQMKFVLHGAHSVEFAAKLAQAFRYGANGRGSAEALQP